MPLKEKEFKGNPVSEPETHESQAETTKADDSKNVKPAKASFDKTTSTSEGSALKTEKIASVVVPDATFGGQKTMGFDAAGFGSSGSGVGFLADQPKTPTASKTRGNTRFDKKVEKVANNINFTPSEQFEIGIRESKPLAQSSEEDQGFNGTYRSDLFRLQKKSGASPAELEYQRSVDFILKDQVYWADGQTVTKYGKTQDLYPTLSASVDGAFGKTYPANLSANFSLKRSNYILDSIDFQAEAGFLNYIIFNETEVVTTPEDSMTLDASSQAYVFDVNRSELEREQIDLVAGDESKDGWSPLARAIEEPGKVVALLHDVEYVTGSELFIANKKLETAFAYQLNKAVKDGQDLTRPGVQAMTGLVNHQLHLSDYSNDMSSIFSKSVLRSGAASLIIPMYDSPAKYNTKADILLQPRGPRMHMAALRNSMKSFRVNPLFVKAYAAREVFGTIDHDYDPSKPLVLTDKAVVTHPLSLSKFGDWGPRDIRVTASGSNMTMKESGGQMLLPAGKQYYVFSKKGDSYHDGDFIVSEDTSVSGKTIISLSLGAVNGTVVNDYFDLIISEIDVTPAGYTKLTLTFGRDVYLGKLTNCYSEITRGYLNQGSYYYGYSDERNTYVREVNIPLVTGLRAYLNDMAGKLNSVLYSDTVPLSNVNVIATHTTTVFSLYDFLLAEAANYMVQDRKQFFTDVSDYSTDHGYPFTQTITVDEATKMPIKNVMLATMDEPMKSLVLDQSSTIDWKFPELFGKLAVVGDNTLVLTPWYINEHSYHDTGSGLTVNDERWAISWPSIRAGNHLASYDSLYAMGEKGVRLNLDMITDVTYSITQAASGLVYKHGLTTDGQPVLVVASSGGILGLNVLRMPRELGWSMTAPAGLLTSPSGRCDHDYEVDQIGSSCFRTVVYHNILATVDPLGNVASTINTSRAADYVQDFAIIDCLPNAGTQDHFYGVSLGAGDCYDSSDAPIEGRSTFEVVTTFDGAKQTSGNHVSLMSDHTNLYFRLNVMPFTLNPYDMSNLSDGGPMTMDPFELSYALGLAGFRASDFSENVYNHLNYSDNLGRLLVSSDLIESSYLK